MEADQENFAVTLTDRCDTHEQWLSVVRFGMPTLLRSPAVLIEIIVREAVKRGRHNAVKSRVVADDAAEILGELGLRFTTTEAE